jgi:hypothetical protein
MTRLISPVPTPTSKPSPASGPASPKKPANPSANKPRNTPPIMKPIKLKSDPLKAICDHWPCLKPWQKKHLVIQARLHALRPIDLVVPATLAQLIVFLAAIFHAPEQALYVLGIGNLLIIAVAMSPALLARKTAHVPHA